MSVSGLMPTEEGERYLTLQEQCAFHGALRNSVRVTQARLAEFDRLMAEGGIEAVVKALEVKAA